RRTHAAGLWHALTVACIAASSGGELPAAEMSLSATPARARAVRSNVWPTTSSASAPRKAQPILLAAAPRAARPAAQVAKRVAANSSSVSNEGGGGTQVTLDFREVDIDNVLKFFSMAAGLTLVKDPGLTGPVTILQPRPVSLDQAFKIL